MRSVMVSGSGDIKSIGGGRAGVDSHFSGSQNSGYVGGGRGAASNIPPHMTGELNAVLGRGMTVTEIRDFISGEFEPVPLQDVWDYVKAQEAAGAVKLTSR